VINGCLLACGQQPGQEVEAAVQEAIDLYIAFVFQGECRVRDWRRKRTGGTAVSVDDASAGTLCTTWPVLRRHLARSFSERFGVQMDQLEGPWLPGSDEPQGSVEPLVSHSSALRALVEGNVKLPLELGSWLEDNTPGEPVSDHVAFARLLKEMRKQMKGEGFLGLMTKDPRHVHGILGSALRSCIEELVCSERA
jgi:hypothetical protein